jgi:hypothetical protein
MVNDPVIALRYGVSSTYRLSLTVPYLKSTAFLDALKMAANNWKDTDHSLPKAPNANEYLDAFLGAKSIVTTEGNQWKALRSIFNPGFSAAHPMTLAPYIVDKSVAFIETMRECASNNRLFSLRVHYTVHRRCHWEGDPGRRFRYSAPQKPATGCIPGTNRTNAQQCASFPSFQ